MFYLAVSTPHYLILADSISQQVKKAWVGQYFRRFRESEE